MTTICLYELHSDAAELLTRALRALLSLPSSQQTVAQIIDNMPIQGHYYGVNYLGRHPNPDIEHRAMPSEDATQLAMKFCLELDLSTLAIHAQAAERFQTELQKSGGMNSALVARRALEIVSGLVHDLASNIYRQIHPAAPPGSGYASEDDRLEHRAYLYSSAYKHDEASIVGYWAETDIFEGPLLFAKGQDGTECLATFMHLTNSNIREETEIIEIAPEQINAFMACITRTDDQPQEETGDFPLPFTAANKGDSHKLTIEEAVLQNIYRDYGQLSRRYEDNLRNEKFRKLGWRADGTRSRVI